jgi:hypothetical protein
MRPPDRHERVVDLGFLIGRDVSAITVNYQFSLTLTSDDDAVLCLEGAFTYRDSGGDVHDLDPSAYPVSLGVALGLFPHTVVQATVEQATLCLVFNDGSRVVVPPQDDYETWQISGPGTSLIVSLPGGELAVWR